jgi:hypothetical protein
MDSMLVVGALLAVFALIALAWLGRRHGRGETADGGAWSGSASVGDGNGGCDAGGDGGGCDGGGGGD